MFRYELASELPPVRNEVHKTKIEKGAKPPRRLLYQLSPAELEAAKEYVEDLPNKGKIHKSKSPFRAPLFFVKKNKCLRDVVNYHALSCITRKNKRRYRGLARTFDRIGEAKVFSRLDRKAVFHQTRVKS